ncbi:MAG: flavodoxin family protein [Candidatus Hodarchaeota archaeon]
MVRALILYHSLFGNTKDVAFSLTKGIEESGIEADCINISEIYFNEIPNYDFLAIGGPTHIGGISKPMKKFLKELNSLNLNGIKGFSFDTRVPSRLNNKKWFIFENSAARRIEKKMKKMRIKILKSYRCAIVTGREGPLEAGVEEKFTEIGRELGNILAS